VKKTENIGHHELKASPSDSHGCILDNSTQPANTASFYKLPVSLLLLMPTATGIAPTTKIGTLGCKLKPLVLASKLKPLSHHIGIRPKTPR